MAITNINQVTDVIGTILWKLSLINLCMSRASHVDH